MRHKYLDEKCQHYWDSNDKVPSHIEIIEFTFECGIIRTRLTQNIVVDECDQDAVVYILEDENCDDSVLVVLGDVSGRFLFSDI